MLNFKNAEMDLIHGVASRTDECDCCADIRLAEQELACLNPLDWAEYELATLEYDHSIPQEATRAISLIFQRLYNASKLPS